MDKEYIVKHNLMEAHRQFMRLSEGYLATSLAEDDEEDNGGMAEEPENQQIEPEDGNQQGNFDNAQGGFEQSAEPGNESPEMMDNQGGADNFGLDQQQAPEMEDFDSATDDDVIDVEDLTQAQEKLNKKQNSIGHDLGDVDDRIITLLTAVENIKGSIEKNNQDITALKSELEKRVPTDTEKLNMQSLKMYPFNVSPNEYWKDKEKEGRYEAEDGSKKEYKITRGDIDGYADRDIENSFDDELNQTMKDIFKGF